MWVPYCGGFASCTPWAQGAWTSVVVAHGLSSCGSPALEHSSVVMRRLRCSAKCGIFLDQGSNPGLLLWQKDSLPLSHQGSLKILLALQFWRNSLVSWILPHRWPGFKCHSSHLLNGGHWGIINFSVPLFSHM